MAYDFVRDTNTWGPNSVPYRGNTLLFSSDDPHLDEAVRAARDKHRAYGIWIPSGKGPDDAATYAAFVKSLSSRYAPQIVVPDLEYDRLGTQGSAGWQWNETVANALRGSGIRIGVNTLPNKSDFNYGAWLRAGATSFLPAAFGGDPRTERYDAQKVIDVLLAAGVPRGMIEPVLAPGQRYGGSASWYTLDDVGNPTFPGQNGSFAAPAASSPGAGLFTPRASTPLWNTPGYARTGAPVSSRGALLQQLLSR